MCIKTLLRTWSLKGELFLFLYYYHYSILSTRQTLKLGFFMLRCPRATFLTTITKLYNLLFLLFRLLLESRNCTAHKKVWWKQTFIRETDTFIMMIVIIGGNVFHVLSFPFLNTSHYGEWPAGEIQSEWNHQKKKIEWLQLQLTTTMTTMIREEESEKRDELIRT